MKSGLQAAGIILGVAVVKLIVTAQTELRSVEAYYWLYAQSPALAYPDHPGMIGWLLWLSTKAFGDGAIAVRLPTIACGAATAWFVFLTARKLYDERVALLACALAALVPMLLLHGAEAAPDAPMLMFWSAAMWALVRALTDRPAWWLAAGAFAGLAMDSKYNAVLLPVGVLVFLATSAEHRAWLRRPWPYLAVIVALAVFAPVLLSTVGRESIAYQGAGRVGEGVGNPGRHLLEFARDQFFELTPFVAGACWTCLRRVRSDAWEDRLLAWLGLPTLALFLCMTLVRSVRGYWAAPGFVSLLILAATMTGVWRKLLAWTWVLLPGFAALPLVLAFVPVERRAPWTHLAKRIEPGFALARDYHDAAQLAYHRRAPAWDFAVLRRERVTRATWPASDLTCAGGDATAVWNKDQWPKDLELVRSRFDRLEEPVEIDVPRVGGRVVFLIVRARGYRPP